MQTNHHFSCSLIHIMDTHPIDLHIVWLVWEIRQVLKAFVRRADYWHGSSSRKTECTFGAQTPRLQPLGRDKSGPYAHSLMEQPKSPQFEEVYQPGTEGFQTRIR